MYPNLIARQVKVVVVLSTVKCENCCSSGRKSARISVLAKTVVIRRKSNICKPFQNTDNADERHGVYNVLHILSTSHRFLLARTPSFSLALKTLSSRKNVSSFRFISFRTTSFALKNYCNRYFILI